MLIAAAAGLIVAGAFAFLAVIASSQAGQISDLQAANARQQSQIAGLKSSQTQATRRRNTGQEATVANLGVCTSPCKCST
jgi:hypothetical protein